MKKDKNFETLSPYPGFIFISIYSKWFLFALFFLKSMLIKCSCIESSCHFNTWQQMYVEERKTHSAPKWYTFSLKKKQTHQQTATPEMMKSSVNEKERYKYHLRNPHRSSIKYSDLMFVTSSAIIFHILPHLPRSHYTCLPFPISPPLLLECWDYNRAPHTDFFHNWQFWTHYFTTNLL